MEKFELILNDALDLINKEEFESAKDILKELIKENNLKKEQLKEAYKNLGLVETNLDNPQSAIEAFEEVLKIEPDDALSLFYLANCYSRTGDKEKAISLFKKVLELRPNYLDAYKSLGMLYIELTKPDEAIEILKKGLENEELEKDYSLYYILATCYMLKKDNKNAIEFLEKSLEFDENNISILNSLSVCYTNEKNYEKALEKLTLAYSKDEENPLTLYNLGTLFQTKGEFKKALEYYQKAYEKEPTISMLASLANCAYEAKEFATAMVLYKNLVDTYPNNLQFRITYIEILDELKNYEEALENVNKLLELDEKNPDLIKKKGTYLRKLGMLEEASQIFQSLVNRGKIDVEVYYNLAFCAVEQNDFDLAKEMFKKCIILEPNNPYAHKDLGVLYLKMNCYDWAKDEMEQAIELEDDVSEFHYSLGVCNMMLGDIELAQKELEKSLVLDENNPDCLAYYGHILIQKEEYEKAKICIKRALTLDPNNFLAKMHFAKLYFKLQKYDIAKEVLLDIIQQTKDEEVLNMLGYCYLEGKEYENAAGIYSKLVQKYPKNHILLTNLAKCELETNRKDKALEHLRQALFIYDDYPEALELLKEVKNA